MRALVVICLTTSILVSCAWDTATATLAAADINPGRGYFQWRGLQVVPPHRNESVAPDVYQRFNWSDLEPHAGTYDFSAITKFFDANPQSRVSFRIRSMIDYGTADPTDTIPRYLPSSIPGWEADAVAPHDGKPDVFIPDWNSEAYLSGVERLWSALAVELAKNGPDGKPRDARLGWIDVGMYGQYGEWYLRTQASSSASDPWVDYAQSGGLSPLAALDASSPSNPRRRLVDAQLKAFPRASWVMFFLYDQKEVLDYVFHRQTWTTSPVGWRFDALGKDQFLEKQWTAAGRDLSWWDGTTSRPAFRDRWKVAPVVAEFYGATADPSVALAQVKDFHVALVGNGNFVSTSGTDVTQWKAVPDFQKAAWAAVGKAAGWRLKADGQSASFSGSTWTWSARLTNSGSAPLPAGWRVRLVAPETSTTTATATDWCAPISNETVLPGASVAFSVSGSLGTLSSLPAWKAELEVGGLPANWLVD